MNNGGDVSDAAAPWSGLPLDVPRCNARVLFAEAGMRSPMLTSGMCSMLNALSLMSYVPVLSALLACSAGVAKNCLHASAEASARL